jgi:uncharacterized protein YacL
MERFLQLAYFFDRYPSPDFRYTKITLGVIILLLLSSIVLSVYRHRYMKDQITKKLIKKYPSLLRTYGIILLVLLVVREAGMPLLSMRFLWLLWAAFFIYSLLKAVFTYKKEYKKRSEQMDLHSKHHKYLPKRKA